MAQSSLTPQQMNAIARQNLLATGISMIKKLPSVNAALGTQVKIPLLRMGIMTGVLLQFSVPVAVTAPSPKLSYRLLACQLSAVLTMRLQLRSRGMGYFGFPLPHKPQKI